MPDPVKQEDLILIHPIPKIEKPVTPGCGHPVRTAQELQDLLILQAGKLGDLSDVEVHFKEKNKEHIFNDRPGHIVDTPDNRGRVKELVKDPTKFLGPDKHGNRWYGEILPDGTQLWGSVWNGVIGNCGINQTPQKYYPESGLCDFDPSKQNK